MSAPQFEEILNRHAIRQNTEQEQQILLSEAARDQESFEALAQEELLRQLLDDPKSRAILLAPEPLWPRIWSALTINKPVFLFAGCAAAALLVAVGIGFLKPPQPAATPAAFVMTGALESFDRLPNDVRSSVESLLGASTAKGVAEGARARIEVRALPDRGLSVSAGCECAANLMVVALPEGEPGRILFPNAQADSLRIAPGGGVTLSLEAGLPPGTRVAALAFPPNFDPLTAIQRGEPLTPPLASAAAEVPQSRP